MLKKFKITLVFLVLLSAKTSQSLNIFEISLIGIGVSFAADQYFDSSINRDNITENKAIVLNKYFESRKMKISSKDFHSLPLQEKLLVIEQLDNF